MSNARYSIMPARAVFDGRLTLADKVVLAALGSYTNGDGWCYPSQATLAERLGIVRSTVCAALKKLAEFGYIDVRARTAKGRGKVGNEYRVLTDLPPMSDQKDIGEKPMSDQADTGAQTIEVAPMSDGADIGADVRSGGQPMSDQPDIAYTEVTTPRERPQELFGVSEEKPKAKTRTRKRVKYTPEFEAFWSAWPQTWRERSDKQLAFKRWQSDIEEWPVETIMAAAKRHIENSRREAYRYCGRADVFLNGKLEAAVEAVRGSVAGGTQEVWDASQRTWVERPL